MGRKPKTAELPPVLFCDASYLIAYFATADESHFSALRIRRRFEERSVKLVTTWPAVGEATTLLFYHYGYAHAMALIRALSAFDLFSPLDNECHQATVLFQEFNKDQKLSFNDLLTYVLIRGRLKDIPIVTFDRDFSKTGLTVFKP